MRIRDAIDRDQLFVLDADTMRRLIEVLDRLYDDSKPFVVDERRDLAQRLEALLERAESTM
jgi:predicted ATPase